jgi:hypothetical protein
MGGLFQNSTFTTTPQIFYNTIPDVDAQAFITAASITDGIQKIAIYRLVTDLKGYSIWTKMKALYPVVGGTAASHAVNLKTPGTYNLTFTLGWTHSSTGMTPNGTSDYANTTITTSLLSLNSGHLSYYSRTNSTGVMGEMGALRNTPNSYTDLGINSSGNGAYIRFNNGGVPTYIANADSIGFYIGLRTASNVLKLFKNGSSIQSLTTVSSATDATRPIYIGAINNQGTAINFTNRQCAFSSIGDGLTDTEAANFYTAVQTYQINLSRQV